MAVFPPLSSFGMFIIQGRLFARLCVLNPDNPAASTTFVANSRIILATLLVGR